jgi:hypothetical protein
MTTEMRFYVHNLYMLCVISALRPSLSPPVYSRAKHIQAATSLSKDVTVKACLDGASFRTPAHATLHPLMNASWRKSHTSLVACLLLFRRY